MIAVALLLLTKFSVEAIRLRCGNYSAPATVSPELRFNSGILVTWDLLSSDPVCSDPSRVPRFSQLRLHDVSLIAACESCPQCTLRLPMRYEWPLGSSINTIYIVARQPPYNRIHTDMDIRYVIVEKMPPSLRNCEIVVREVKKLDQLLTFTNAVLFFGVFTAVVFCTCLARWVCAKIY
uniref:Rh187 n=1 Tax=Haemonchus contortus TaxID=6289 RepID=A0A7I4YQE2_HAECO